ncbi:MAG: alpha/beta fold hydrolase, partial [Pseudomonadota bacterium]
FGICQGGTMAACYAARHGNSLRGLITAVAPIDFHADMHDPDPAHGLLHLWIRSFEQPEVDMLLNIAPNLPGVLMGAVFSQLNPVRTLAKYTVSIAEQSLQPAAGRMFLAMEKWLLDRPDLPGAMAKVWLEDLYRRNALVSGNLMMDGQPVNLSAIDMPVLNIFATNDHITPPPCSRALGQYVRANYQELAVPAGHIGTFVGARAQTLVSPAITAWLDGQV